MGAFGSPVQFANLCYKTKDKGIPTSLPGNRPTLADLGTFFLKTARLPLEQQLFSRCLLDLLPIMRGLAHPRNTMALELMAVILSSSGSELMTVWTCSLSTASLAWSDS